MSKVIALGYLGVTAPDLAEWRTFATEVLGTAIGSGSTDQRLRMRVDERGWRVQVEQGPGGMSFYGWEVLNAAALEALAADLDAHGIPYKSDAELAKDRGVNGLLVCSDPAGNQMEFFHGAYIAADPFVSPTGVRFVTSDRGPGDMGFGHVVCTFPDEAEAKHFFLDVLGFNVSDTMVLTGGGRGRRNVWFTHVNPRHHSLGFVGTPGFPPVFRHFMLEVEDIDMVGYTLDRAIAHGIHLHQSLGRHSNDHMLSFYMDSPAGFAVEIGTGARRIDDQVWTTANYDNGHFWGHHFPEEH